MCLLDRLAVGAALLVAVATSSAMADDEPSNCARAVFSFDCRSLRSLSTSTSFASRIELSRSSSRPRNCALAVSTASLAPRTARWPTLAAPFKLLSNMERVNRPICSSFDVSMNNCGRNQRPPFIPIRRVRPDPERIVQPLSGGPGPTKPLDTIFPQIPFPHLTPRHSLTRESKLICRSLRA